MKSPPIFVILLLLTYTSFSQVYVTPRVVTTLASSLNETSGLVNLDGEIWTHNDSGGLPEIYQIDTVTGNVLRTVWIQNATAVDWEDLTADDSYVYIADVGNNSGDRTNLRIYRVSRGAIATSDAVNADIIDFSYSDQTSWTPAPNATNFDCEAIIAYQDSLFLFSKNWLDHQTKQYALSNQPGSHLAQYRETFNVEGLVCGAEILPSSHILVLAGYSLFTEADTWTFTGFIGTDFFSGTYEKMVWTSFTQCEGVCRNNENSVYLSSEAVPFPFSLSPTLFFLDLGTHVSMMETGEEELPFQLSCKDRMIVIRFREIPPHKVRVTMTSITGQEIYESQLTHAGEISIPLNFSAGCYMLTIQTDEEVFSRKIMVNY